MGNLWLKIKVWTKITVFVLALIYILLFVMENADKPVTIWVWFGDGNNINTTLLRLAPSLLAVGVVGTLLTRTALKTIGQFREMQKKNRTAQMGSDLASIKARAAMLQTKPSSAPGMGPSSAPTAGPVTTAPPPSDRPRANPPA
jgi:hypothetical protein